MPGLGTSGAFHLGVSGKRSAFRRSTTAPERPKGRSLTGHVTHARPDEMPGLSGGFNVYEIENPVSLVNDYLMSTVEEIEKAIGCLPREEFWKLTDRLIERRESAWDSQIAADATAGRLDSLWAEAEKEIEAGETQSLDAFLDDQKL